MKKAIMSPLCSGLIIPGLGQIINQDLKKGILLLGGIFVIFIAGIIKLIRLIHSIFGSGNIDIADPEMIMARLRAEDLTLLWAMAALFVLLWIYSVVDAYVRGKRIDAMEERDLTP
jgi:uncharacterized membrane protein